MPATQSSTISQIKNDPIKRHIYEQHVISMEKFTIKPDNKNFSLITSYPGTWTLKILTKNNLRQSE
jgi:hypothetical protein